MGRKVAFVSVLHVIPGGLMGETVAIAQPPEMAARLDDEREWLGRHRRGDATAFRELVERYGGAIHGYIVRCGVQPAVREDLFQDVFFKVHCAADRYDASQPLKPWLFTIAANTVRSYFRRRSVFERFFSSERPYETASSQPSLHATFEAQQTAVYLDANLQRLSLAQREVLVLVCIEGLSLDETAAALSMPVNTVKTNLQRGRRALAKALARRDITLARENDQ